MKELKIENQWILCWKNEGSKYFSNRFANGTVESLNLTWYLKECDDVSNITHVSIHWIEVECPRVDKKTKWKGGEGGAELSLVRKLQRPSKLQLDPLASGQVDINNVVAVHPNV